MARVIDNLVILRLVGAVREPRQEGSCHRPLRPLQKQRQPWLQHGQHPGHDCQEVDDKVRENSSIQSLRQV